MHSQRESMEDAERCAAQHRLFGVLGLDARPLEASRRNRIHRGIDRLDLRYASVEQFNRRHLPAANQAPGRNCRQRYQ